VSFENRIPAAENDRVGSGILVGVGLDDVTPILGFISIIV
jgi:hypothetical protein